MRTDAFDFDLPDADNERLRALEAELNDMIVQDRVVSASYIPLSTARHEKGLLRSRSVAPP